MRIEKLKQKYIAQGLSKSSIKQLIIKKKYFSDSIKTQSLLILKTCLQYEMVIVLWVSLCRLSCVFFHSIFFFVLKEMNHVEFLNMTASGVKNCKVYKTSRR